MNRIVSKIASWQRPIRTLAPFANRQFCPCFLKSRYYSTLPDHHKKDGTTFNSTEALKKKSQNLWQTVKAYRVGVIGGLGIFTGISLMCYFFMPTINKTSTKTASKVLTSQEVYEKATFLTKNITGDLLKDEATYVLLCSLLVQVLKSDAVRTEFIQMLKTITEDPFAEEIVRLYCIRILRDPEIEKELTNLLSSASQKVLAQEDFQRSAGIAMRKSLWKFFSNAQVVPIYKYGLKSEK